MNITIYLNQVKLLCEAETRKSSLMQVDEEHPDERLEASMGEEFSDLAWFYHHCRQAVDAVVGMLGRFITAVNDTNVATSDGDNAETGTAVGSTTVSPGLNTSWELAVSLDSRRAVSTDLLASQMERFVAYSVLADWAQAVSPTQLERYAGLRNEARDEIRKNLYFKKYPTYGNNA